MAEPQISIFGLCPPDRIVADPYIFNIGLCQLFCQTSVLYGRAIDFNFWAVPSLQEFDKSLWTQKTLNLNPHKRHHDDWVVHTQSKWNYLCFIWLSHIFQLRCDCTTQTSRSVLMSTSCNRNKIDATIWPFLFCSQAQRGAAAPRTPRRAGTHGPLGQLGPVRQLGP